MKIELLTLIFLSKTFFFKVVLVNCVKNPMKYELYFNKVTNYIRIQITQMNLEHLSVRIENDKIIKIKDVLKYKPENIYELLKTYYIIVDLLNYLFAEVLEIFTEHLKIILGDCDCFFGKHSFENATYSTVVLLNVAKNSNLMFEYLYKAIIFIDYLDVKLVLRNLIHPKTVVEEIYTVKHYTILMKKTEMVNYVNYDGSIKIKEVLEDIIEINNFVNKIASITDVINKNNVTIINSKIKLNLREKYYGEFINNTYKMNFVNFVREKFNYYCSETIKNYYLKIGFDQLLNPKIAKILPPQNYNFPQHRAIKILNTLFSEGDWKTLNHIKIIVDGQIITTNQIIRDNVNYCNFNLKKKYFLHLMRCRYAEVLKNYNTYMSAVIETCKIERRDKNLNGYKDCCIQFFKMVKDSKIMFNQMLLALDQLKAASIWELTYNNSPACLIQTYKLLSNYFPKLEELNLTKYDFLNLSIDKVDSKASKFLFDFQKARGKFNRDFIRANKFTSVSCSIECDNLENSQLIKSWMTMVSTTNKNNTLESQLCLYECALDQFMKFFNVTTISVYNWLGFNKISVSI